MRNEILEDILDYFESELPIYVAQLNELCEGLNLPEVVEFDAGYRDIFAGLREYPAMIIVNRGRSIEPFFTTYRLLIGLVVRSEDYDQLETWGQSYEDILEIIIRDDHTLGDACLDSNSVNIDNDVVNGLYIISCEMEVQIDRGGR